MKEYDVTITETLQRTVTVEAASRLEAEEKVTDAWDHQDYVLGAEDFTGVAFDTVAERDLTTEKEKIEVLLVKPNMYPKKAVIGKELEDLQSAVAGDIEVVYPFEDAVGIILNGEGKILGLPLNRAAYTEDGDLYDIYAGNFLIVGLTEDDFGSLTPEQLEKYEKLFHQPETFVRMGKGVIAIPLPDERVREMEQKPANSLEPVKTAPVMDIR